MKKQNSKKQNDVIADLQNILNQSLTTLDLQGTDETITKVLTIVNQAFTSVKSNEDISPEKLYSRAMRIYEQQKSLAN